MNLCSELFHCSAKRDEFQCSVDQSIFRDFQCSLKSDEFQCSVDVSIFSVRREMNANAVLINPCVAQRREMNSKAAWINLFSEMFACSEKRDEFKVGVDGDLVLSEK